MSRPPAAYPSLSPLVAFQEIGNRTRLAGRLSDNNAEALIDTTFDADCVNASAAR